MYKLRLYPGFINELNKNHNYVSVTFRLDYLLGSVSLGKRLYYIVLPKMKDSARNQYNKSRHCIIT